jgi:hypothetical protein
LRGYNKSFKNVNWKNRLRKYSSRPATVKFATRLEEFPIIREFLEQPKREYVK